MFYPAENAEGARGFKVKKIVYPEEFADATITGRENRQR